MLRSEASRSMRWILNQAPDQTRGKFGTTGRGTDIDFDLITLRLLESAVRLGSISAAAVEQNIAVSAVSRRLSDLEHRLGTAVLYRKGRGVTPTPAGEVLLRHAENLLGLAERAADEMSDFAEGNRGHVRLAANPSAIAQFLPDVLAAFIDANPNVRIALNEAVSDVIVQQLRDGLVDAGIFSAAVDHGGIETFPYRTDRLCAVVPSVHPLAGRSTVTFADIVPYRHVALADGSSLFQWISDAARALDAELDVAVSVRSFDGVRRMVARGLGIAVLPAGVTEPYAESDGLCVIDLSEDWAARAFLIGVRERQALSRPAERFLAHMLTAAD